MTRRAPLARNIVVFDTIEHAPTPEREFTLAGFGLPEVERKPEPGGPNRPAYWLIGLGIAFLVGAIGTKLYARRLRTAA